MQVHVLAMDDVLVVGRDCGSLVPSVPRSMQEILLKGHVIERGPCRHVGMGARKHGKEGKEGREEKRKSGKEGGNSFSVRQCGGQGGKCAHKAKLSVVGRIIDCDYVERQERHVNSQAASAHGTDHSPSLSGLRDTYKCDESDPRHHQHGGAKSTRNK